MSNKKKLLIKKKILVGQMNFQTHFKSNLESMNSTKLLRALQFNFA
jgi:hypothetical protein